MASDLNKDREEKEPMLSLSLTTKNQQVNKESSPKSTAITQHEEGMFKCRRLLDHYYWYAGADYLFWKVSQSHLDYVIPNAPLPSSIPTNHFAGDTAQIGSIKEVNYNWNSGFRLNVGSIFPPDFWNIEAQYTYFHTHGSSRAFPETNSILYGTLNEYTFVSPASASASAQFNYNVGDLFLAKRIGLSKQILCDLHMGATIAWLNHHFRTTYYPVEGATRYNGILHRRWNFKGGGIKTGFSTDWYLGNGLSIFSTFNISALYGSLQNYFKQISVSYSSTDPIYPVQGNRLHDHRVVCSLQFLAGPSFGWRFSDWGFNLSAGYELNLWYNVHETLFSEIAVSTSSRVSRYEIGTLGLQGLTVHIDGYF
jgi:hypothetical protein